MIPPAKPPDERQRLDALASYGILDTPAETEFDDITAIAAHLMDVPIALISLVDADRQWFKSRVGLDVTETHRDISFCGHAVAAGELLAVEDATRDARFCDNPLVTDGPTVRFYVGAPLINPAGHVLGTLCAIDSAPRAATDEQKALLARLARQVVRLLEHRRERRQLLGGLGDHAVEFFRNSLEMLCVATFDGYFEWLNPAWNRVLGFSDTELTQKPFIEFVHPDDRQLTLDEAARLAHGGHETVSFDNRYICKNGGYRWLRWTAAADLDARRLYCVARDVTAKKKAIAEMRASNALLSTILETAIDGILTIRTDGTIASSNSAASTLFGRETVEIVGSNISELISSQSGQPLAIATLVGKATEAKGRRSAAESFPLELAVGEMEVGGERVFTATIRDISARKLVDAMKDEFVSTVSHELRTPLTSVHGSLRLIASGITGPLSAEAEELIEIALNNSHRLIRLVNDILDLEKSQTGTISLDLVDTTISHLVDRSLEATSGLARDYQVSVERETHTNAIVRADPERFVQILTNLVSNALKFSEPHGTVRIRCSMPSHDLLRVEVIDTGVGIPREHHERIFQRFHQVDGSDSRGRGGTGLGLPIAKMLTELHEGRIGVRDTPGGGSTLWIEVPARPPSGEYPFVPALPPRAHYTLIVEDDAALARVLAVEVEQAGYTARTVGSLAAAADAIAERLPDAVLLDISLPDGSGLDLLEQLRATPTGQDVPVIVISGQARPDEAVQANAAVVDWIVKPIVDDRVLRTLRTAMRAPGTSRVLLVQDDEQLRSVIAAQVESLGAECLHAPDGPTAVQLARETPPDLIILDVAVPIIDGFGVVAVLQRGPTKHIPLIVMTDHQLSDDDRRTLRLGITKYIDTASDSLDFTAHVRELLDGCLDPKATETFDQ